MKPLLFAATMLTIALGASSAWARDRRYVIAVGNNAPPRSMEGGDALPQLRYADDDAAAFASFAIELGATTTLLTVLDEDSQRRYRELSARARPPSLVELRLVLDEHKAQFERDRRNGDQPVMFFYYSGHGTLAGPSPSLTLLDGPLTQGVLYDEILTPLSARYIHLVVDACHAEAVVRPRDAQAEVARMTPSEEQAYVRAKTLAGFPSVGAVIATSTTTQAHEWDGFRGGVFTHEVLSGLRGAADVNHDGTIEYSELYAFLGSANREITDSRARLAVLVHPPAVNPRAPLSDLSAASGVRLKSASGIVGQLSVEDDRGNRLADLHPEAGFTFTLALPDSRPLYLRSRTGESSFRADRHEVVLLDDVSWQAPTSRARGSMASALERGLFASPFGPVYYRGFVDGHPDLVAVDDAARLDAGSVRDERPRSTLPAWVALGTAAALGVTSGSLALAALQDKKDYETTSLERQAADAREQFLAHRSWAIASGVSAAVSAGIGYWLWPKGHSASVAQVRPAVSLGGATTIGIVGDL